MKTKPKQSPKQKKSKKPKTTDSRPTVQGMIADRAGNMAPTTQEIMSMLDGASDGMDQGSWNLIAKHFGWDRLAEALAEMRTRYQDDPGQLDAIVGAFTSESLAYDYDTYQNAYLTRMALTDDISKREMVDNLQPDVVVQSPPQPVAPGLGRRELEERINGLAQFIINVTSSVDSPPEIWAQGLLDVAEAAGMRLAEMPADQRGIMARVIAGTMSQQDDADVTKLMQLVGQYLRMLRPPVAEFVLDRSKTTSEQVKDLRAWTDGVWAALEKDGFNDLEELDWLQGNVRQTLDAIEKGLGSPAEQGARWAQMQGYIFQLNQTMKAWGEYRLVKAELALGIPDTDETGKTGKHKVRSIDTVELILQGSAEPIPRLREYKTYAQNTKPAKATTDEFTAQLGDYVKRAQSRQEKRELEYVFPGKAPLWVKTELGGAAKTLNTAGRTLYLTENGATTPVAPQAVKKQQSIQAAFQAAAKPKTMIPLPDPPGDKPPVQKNPLDTDVITNKSGTAPIAAPTTKKKKPVKKKTTDKK
ncbi:hypothetical protein J5X84_19875 [Streptosporangiaceae bacterium NEAU-GS5]|nr:hypothetical protein [Streptosporangiaceae bacterium NEAU-GS5]